MCGPKCDFGDKKDRANRLNIFFRLNQKQEDIKMPQSQMNSLAVNYVRPVMMISYAIIMLIFESLLFFTPLVALVPYIVFLLSSFANFFAQLFSKLYFPFSLISHPFYLFSNFMFVFDTFFGLLSSTYFGILTMLFFAYFPMIVLAVIYVLIFLNRLKCRPRLVYFRH